MSSAPAEAGRNIKNAVVNNFIRDATKAEMTVNKSRFSKSERKELRRLAGLAYEHELAKALESLEGKFEQWRKKKITTFELNAFIHKFHNGIARDLWSFYTHGHAEFIVAQAIANGVISKTEINLGILRKFNEDSFIKI